MEVDVERPAATFEYELASKDMILAPPDERAKGMCVIVRSKRQQLCREVPNGRRARPTCHTGSVSGAVFMIAHSDFDLEQACTIENSPASAATNSEAVSNESTISSPQALFPGFLSLERLT
jgi:hypothetical protein